MKIATITYTGNTRQKTHRGPSGRQYVFGSTDTATDSVEDAEFFDDKPNYNVDWTTVGMLARRYADGYSSAKKALSEMGYRQKQKLAKAAGVQANQAEEDLEEELEEFAEQLQHDMEHQQR